MRSLYLAVLCLINVTAQANIHQIESVNSRIDRLEDTVLHKEPSRESNELDLGGEFLYWQPLLANPAIYALAHNSISVPGFGEGAGIDTHQEGIFPSFDFSPAFRVWGVYGLPFDEWNLKFIWTHLRSEGSSSVTKTPQFDIHVVWDSTNAMVIDFASGKINEYFDVFELNFGKELFWSQLFCLNYYLGAKGAFVKEKLHVVYNGSFGGKSNSYEHTTITNPYSGIGLNNGLNLTWNLIKRLKFYTKGEVALLWGKCDSKFKEAVYIGEDINASYLVEARNPLFAVQANLVAEAGFQWDVTICKAELSLLAGYEFNYWPNQILWNRYLTNDQNLSGGVAYILQENGSLGFQGLNVGASLSF